MFEMLVRYGSATVVIGNDRAWAHLTGERPFPWALQRAHEINAVPGGLWKKRTRRYSGRHVVLAQDRLTTCCRRVLSFDHPWASWGPIHHPLTGEVIGVLAF
jgi:hypothetical protein